MTEGAGRVAEVAGRAPLSPFEFRHLMQALGPFETRPRIAVAVSGGADSMALALLVDEWAAHTGAEFVAVTVDHRLRAQSGAEVAAVGGWLAARGIRHSAIAWTGAKPAADVQAAARRARYGLLGDYCRDNGILHLLVAHHQEDQAETVLLRLGRGSGVDGLAAMAATVATPWGRILRPLLGIPRHRLLATLADRGQDWLEDPSNHNPVFARVRIRGAMAGLADEGFTPGRLAATAGRLARARDALDRISAEAAARWVDIHPAGFGQVDAAALAPAGDEVALRLLARLVMVIGGAEHPPRVARLQGLLDRLRVGDGDHTLGGCRLRRRGGSILVCREVAKVAGPVWLTPGVMADWDGRFRLWLDDGAPAGLRLGALGAVGLARLKGALAPAAVPSPARPSLPAIFDQDGVSAVPHLGYNRGGGRSVVRRVDLAPRFRLTESGRRLVRV